MAFERRPGKRGMGHCDGIVRDRASVRPGIRQPVSSGIWAIYGRSMNREGNRVNPRSDAPK